MIKDSKTGLFLPKKRRELWPNDDARKFKALARVCEERAKHQGNVAVVVAIICTGCNAACEPSAHEVTGEMVLSCACSVRVMEGVR